MAKPLKTRAPADRRCRCRPSPRAGCGPISSGDRRRRNMYQKHRLERALQPARRGKRHEAAPRRPLVSHEEPRQPPNDRARQHDRKNEMHWPSCRASGNCRAQVRITDVDSGNGQHDDRERTIQASTVPEAARRRSALVRPHQRHPDRRRRLTMSRSVRSDVPGRTHARVKRVHRAGGSRADDRIDHRRSDE